MIDFFDINPDPFALSYSDALLPMIERILRECRKNGMTDAAKKVEEIIARYSQSDQS